MPTTIVLSTGFFIAMLTVLIFSIIILALIARKFKKDIFQKENESLFFEYTVLAEPEKVISPDFSILDGLGINFLSFNFKRLTKTYYWKFFNPKEEFDSKKLTKLVTFLKSLKESIAAGELTAEKSDLILKAVKSALLLAGDEYIANCLVMSKKDPGDNSIQFNSFIRETLSSSLYENRSSEKIRKGVVVSLKKKLSRKENKKDINLIRQLINLIEKR